MVTYNALKVFPSVPCERGYFLARKNTVFFINGCTKTAAVIDEYDESDNGVLLPLLFS